MSIRTALKTDKWLNNIQWWVFPGTCILCRRPSGRSCDLCTTCQKQLLRVPSPCPHCARPAPKHHIPCPACRRQAPAFRHCLAPLHYTAPGDRLIQAFKFERSLQKGRCLAQLTAIDIAAFYRARDFALPELLIPVPLHRARLRKRGYNQALELARCWHDELDIPVAYRCCRRRQPTLSQHRLGAGARQANIRSAFVCTAADIIKDRRIAIVDDVVTTMATAQALTLTLYAAGARSVDVWALARTLKD